VVAVSYLIAPAAACKNYYVYIREIVENPLQEHVTITLFVVLSVILLIHALLYCYCRLVDVQCHCRYVDFTRPHCGAVLVFEFFLSF
jgi:hypothetical protein